MPGLRVEDVASLEDVAQVINRGKQNRSTFATNMNEHSSRSHLVLSLHVVGSAKIGGGGKRGGGVWRGQGGASFFSMLSWPRGPRGQPVLWLFVSLWLELRRRTCVHAACLAHA